METERTSAYLMVNFLKPILNDAKIYIGLNRVRRVCVIYSSQRKQIEYHI